MNTLERARRAQTGFPTFLSHADARCRLCGSALLVPSSMRDDGYPAGEGQFSALCSTGKHARTWYDVAPPAQGGVS